MQSSKNLHYIFGYDLIDLLIFLLAWVGGWNLIDTAITQLVDINDKAKYIFVNTCILIMGILLLYIKHRCFDSPYV